MKLTTKGRYAVTAMLDMAICCHDHKQAVSLADISDRQDISLSYLEQLFGKLRKNGLVVSTRGPGGGYKLKNDISRTYVSDIITAVEEPLDIRNCKGKSNCGKNGQSCLTHELWDSLSLEIQRFLKSVSLADLIDKKI